MALAVYAPRLHPSVPGGDAGELIVAAARLEIAHPPGYPLYTLLAHVATWLPFGSVAWRVNLVSALCQAGAASFVAAAVRAATRSTGAAIVAGLLFAFSPLIFTYAVGAEVFGLHELLVAALVYVTLRWRQGGGGMRLAVAVAVVIGLGLAHHHTIVFYALPVLAWLLWCAPELRTVRALAMLTAAIALGLAWYLHLPLAARTATTLSWGDPGTIGGFIDHLLRRDYGTFQLGAPGESGASTFATRLAAWAGHTLDATLYVGAALAVGGAVVWLAARRSAPERAWVALWVAALALYVLGFHVLANLPVADPLYRSVTARFWQQSDVVVFVLLGLGLAACTGAGPAARAVAVTVGVVLVAVQLGRGAGAHDHRDDDTVARYGRALLEPLAPGTVLLTRGDLVTNVVRYQQAAEGVRTDVTVLDQELLTKSWYVARAVREHPDLAFPGTRYDPAAPDGFSMRAFLDANAGRRPFAVYPDWKPGDASASTDYELTPAGLALDVARVGRAFEDRYTRGQAGLRTLDDYGWQRVGLYDPGTWERVAREDVWQARARFGTWLLTQALARDGDARLFQAARVQLERAEHGHPDPPWHLFRNLGIVYERLALREPKLRERQLAAWRRYLATAPPDDDGRTAIAATVARLEAETPAP
jgi:hypothetical protein